MAQAVDFPVAGDCADLAWAQKDAALILWERPARAARLLWYSARGELLLQLGDCGLLRTASLSPSAQYIAVGSLDGKLHVLSATAMKPVARFAHSLKAACAEADDSEMEVCQEELLSDPAGPLGSVGYVRAERPSAVRIPEALAEAAVDANGVPRQGIGTLAWSPCERYLAAKHDGTPTAVWVWDLGRLALAAVLVQRSAVRSFAWGKPAAAGCGPRLAAAPVGEYAASASNRFGFVEAEAGQGRERSDN